MDIPMSVSTVCFTGPRPSHLHGYEREPYEPIVGYTERVCRELIKAGATAFISGGAQGFDQLAFWAVNRIRKDRPDITNIVYIPYPSQPKPWRVNGPFGQKDYQKMLDSASYSTVLAPPPTSKPEAIARLHTRNHMMVDNSSLVIALLAGRSLDWQHAQGGTAECVRYAHGAGKPILAISYRPGRDDDRFQTELIMPNE